MSEQCGVVCPERERVQCTGDHGHRGWHRAITGYLIDHYAPKWLVWPNDKTEGETK